MNRIIAAAIGVLALSGCVIEVDRETPAEACEVEVRRQVEQIRRGADPDMPMPPECGGITDGELQQIVQRIYDEYNS